MDVFNDRIIDVSLNVLGYLIAGGLGVLLYSFVQERRIRAAARVGANSGEESAEAPLAAHEPGPTLQFVSFNATGPETLPEVEPETAPSASGVHRNRREIIRMAREMLREGAAGEQIRQSLPISSNELALLKNPSRN